MVAAEAAHHPKLLDHQLPIRTLEKHLCQIYQELVPLDHLSVQLQLAKRNPRSQWDPGGQVRVTDSITNLIQVEAIQEL